MSATGLGKTFNKENSKEVCQVCGGLRLIKKRESDFEKENKDVDNHDSNHLICPCFDRLSRESVLGGYAPGAESALQAGDRQSGRVPLLTAV